MKKIGMKFVEEFGGYEVLATYCCVGCFAGRKLGGDESNGFYEVGCDECNAGSYRRIGRINCIR